MKPNLPDWQTPEQLLSILLGLPEQRRNRSLYLLVWQYGGEDAAVAELGALRRLLAEPALCGLENVKLWLQQVLYGDPALWPVLWPDVAAVLDKLHPESCRVYGEFGGMFAPLEQAERIVGQLLALGSVRACEMADCCLAWHEGLQRRRPEWSAQQRERQQIRCAGRAGIGAFR